MSIDHVRTETAAIKTQINAVFASLELSRSKWVVTSISPGAGEKMSRHVVEGGDLSALCDRLEAVEAKARARTGSRKPYEIIVMQEAGLDGFWLHRALQARGYTSHVVDAASIAAPRRKRKKKTDRLDGEALLRALLAWSRGEPRVCSMVRPPTPEQEDVRRACRERKELVKERIVHVNRIKGLLFAQGIGDYEPLRRDRRRRLEPLRTGDGRALEPNLKKQLNRMLDRLELLLDQLAEVEQARDERVGLAPKRKKAAAKAAPTAQPACTASQGAIDEGMAAPAATTTRTVGVAQMLIKVGGIGAEFTSVLSTEGLERDFRNRRQAGSFAGLTSTPWISGQLDHEQGVSKAGNPRLRTTMIQLAWLWPTHQPHSALTRWYKDKLAHASGRGAKQKLVVALARKLFIALWRYTAFGEPIEGAIMKA
jgi:transposase